MSTNQLSNTYLIFNIRSGGSTHDRICELGFTIIKNGEIYEKYFSEILPPPNPLYENDWQQDKYKNCPNLKEVWHEIEGIFKETEHIFAFNLSTHKSNLEKSLEVYGLKLPSNHYHCLYNLSKEILNHLDNHTFLDICTELLINPFQSNHEALSKAIGASEILLALEQKTNDKNILTCISNKPSKQETIGNFFQKQAYLKSSSTEFIDDFMLKLPFVTPTGNDFFLNKSIVITGEFQRYPNRVELETLLKEKGAIPKTSISGKTNIVIVGSGAGPSKIQKVLDLIEKGQSIEVINQEKLYLFLDDINTNY
jgi:DNA polymerase-3 subunit epsilon